MNHIYRSIWSDALNTWIAVSELATGKSKTKNSVGWAEARSPSTTQTTNVMGFLRQPILPIALLACSNAYALPTGNELVAGQATVTNPAANQMQINQTSNRAVINWQGFSVGQNEAVNIQQPNANAALLNRVVGQDASQIQGKIQSNGQVYLSNPNGVILSKTAQVDVGGLIATTHDIKNEDFMAGKNHFTQSREGAKVENHGTINTTNGGVVALIGESVTNTGNINTPKGTTALAAGKTIDLDMKGDGLVEVKVTEAALNAQIENHGAITADGGRVVLSAKSANALMDTVINQNGIVKAQGLIERNGEIILDGGENGAVKVSGTLDVQGDTGGNISLQGNTIELQNTAIIDASGKTQGGNILIGDKQHTEQVTLTERSNIQADVIDNGEAGNIEIFANMDKGQVNVQGKLNARASKQGNGGFIETSAAKVKIANTANLSTKAEQGNSGTWLIDPTDFTIAASGGDMTGATLSTNLAGGNVTIQSTSGTTGVNGDVNVNDVVNWSANTLTLNALRNININANLNGSGTAKLALLYGQASLNGGATDNYFIGNGAKVNLAAGQNFSTQKGSNVANLKSYTVITQLGVANDTNTDTLQGIKNNLSGLYMLGADIDAADTANWTSATGIGFEPIGSVFNNFVGQLHGLGHSISNLTIRSNRTTDGIGLVGFLGTDGKLSDIGLNNAVITSPNTASQAMAMLVGYNYGSISNSYAKGSVGDSIIGGIFSGDSAIGGLVGNNIGNISNSYATGSVRGFSSIGGLVGNNVGNIRNSYGTGSVNGDTNVGGLVGLNIDGSISNSYATGSVNGNQYVGGLVGYNIKVANNNSISNSYATGSVNGNQTIGGLVGFNQNGSISNSYATGSGSGNQNIGGLVGFNLNGIISNSYATGSGSGIYGVGGLVGFNYGSIDNSYATGKVSANTVGGLVGLNAGSISNSFWNVQTTGQTIGIGAGSSTGATGKTTAEMMQQATFQNAGWSIADTGGSNAVWRIYEGQTTPLLRSFLIPLTVNINSNKIYDGLNTLGTLSYTNTLTGVTITPNANNVLGTAFSASKNVGTHPITGLYSSQTGYDFSFGTATITPATLSYNATLTSRTYGSANPTFTGTVTGFVNGEDLNSATTGTLNFTSVANALSNVGQYAITGSGLTANNGNYVFVQQTANNSALTITRAPLTITATDLSKLFGQLISFNGTEFTVSGLLNGDSIGSVDLSSLGALISASVLGSPYDIIARNATGGTFNPNNYNIQYINGKLTVEPLPVVVIPSISLDQLVPLQTSTTELKHAHELRWFYQHWVKNMFARARYGWLHNDMKQHFHALLNRNDIKIVNEGMKLPK